MKLEPLLLPCPPGEVSDGYHTFNELYEHRHALFIALMKSYPKISWRSQCHSDGSWLTGWFIAGIDFKPGPITYHLPARLWDELDGHIDARSAAPEWDGHTPDDVVRRLYLMEPVVNR